MATRRTRAKMTVTPVPECEPIGELATPEISARSCRFCPAILTPKARTPTCLGKLDDWIYVDREGRAGVDNSPELLKTDPKRWWDELAKNDIWSYSTLKVRFDLVGNPFWHFHSPGECLDPAIPERQKLLTPTCCDAPMYAGVEGWHCRLTRQRFPYRTD